ncbi:MAG: alpha-L-rhamnosidase [Prevotellaceae bacterium]|jgi:hypothetical protein|nr:alpha-L-rhamnosidase [Prevotellaceae bacterium]
MMKNTFCFLLVLCLGHGVARSQAPTGLTTDLLEYTDRVFLDGYPANISLAELGSAIERYQIPEIRNFNPMFGWMLDDSKPDLRQRAYRILVASTTEALDADTPDMWDSKWTDSDNSVAVQYAGKPLLPSTVYYWKVDVKDNYGIVSGYSDTRSFLTAAKFDGGQARYPVQLGDEHPAVVERRSKSLTCADFGRASFARLKLTLSSDKGGDTVVVRMSEKISGGRPDMNPGGSIRHAEYRLALMRGTHTYSIKIRPDKRNTHLKGNASMVDPILMPPYIGELTPFRCCEIDNYAGSLSAKDIVRLTASYFFDEGASRFTSSDTVLNRVWDLCKYSIKATSFAGTYIDGDRERIPYEREALISQLGQYCVDREYSIARHSHEYLIFNPTWPSEWLPQSLWMAWNDYMYTGNSRSLQMYYDDLRAKSLIGLRDDNELVSTRTGKKTPEFAASVHFKGTLDNLHDIVDWPHSGILGLGKNEGGETDGFAFTDYNAVVNAYHYKSLVTMSQIADVLGKKTESEEYARLADRTKQAFNLLMFDPAKGCYKDGVDTDHCSLHANMFALAFGLTPEKNIRTVIEFIKSRQMACSISGALILLEALYKYHEADYAYRLLASADERSWYNTLRIGATISIEAWDNKYKPNLDWNQSAGSAPAYLIPRRLMGIEPIEPGFRKIRIKPQPSTLSRAEIKTPCIRGDIFVSFENDPGKSFSLKTNIPANSSAEIWLPKLPGKYRLTVDDVPQKGTVRGNFVVVNAGSGEHTFLIMNYKL